MITRWAGRVGEHRQRRRVRLAAASNYPARTLTLVISRVFRIPYPLSSRCEVPMEDPTNRGFCRPLPVDLFPIPVLPEMPRESQPIPAPSRVRMQLTMNLLYL